MKRRAPKAKRQDYATLLRFCDEIRAERDKLKEERDAFRVEGDLFIASQNRAIRPLDKRVCDDRLLLDCMAKALESANMRYQGAAMWHAADRATMARQRDELIKLRAQIPPKKPWWAKSFRELLS